MIEELSRDKKTIRTQVRVLFTVVSVLILLIGANFYIALANPNEKIQTIVGGIGPRGEQGEKGIKGDRGEAGNIGETGPRGIQGETGQPGLNGQSIVGATGPRGFRGDTGEQGIQGINGDQIVLSCNEVESYLEWKYINQPTTYALLYFNPIHMSCLSFSTTPVDYED